MMSVKKRIVYYLSGFDPRGVRYYYALYKEHAQKQSNINGIDANVSSRHKLHNHIYQWELEANDSGNYVHTEYRFLSWDDIIRAEWSSGIISYYKDLIYCIIAYIFSGLVMRFAKVSPKQMLAAFYPVVYLIGALFTAVYSGMILIQWWDSWISIIPAVILGIAILLLFERFGNKIGVFWLLRIYAFSVRWGRSEIGTIEERVDTFAHEIASAVKNSDDVDEILLVSHSVGTILAVSVLARALQNQSPNWKKFAMVTLGECIPLMSFQPNAIEYRKELQKIASREDILWIDYTAPIDGACFPQHDFMKSIGIENNAIDLRFLSPRFHTLFDKINYQKLRRDWYMTHFLYLMSNDKAGAYDYFVMTAGAENLRNKFNRSRS